MIYGNINNIGKLSAYPKIIQRALQYIEQNDFKSMEPGKYEIEGKDFFVQVSDTKADIIKNKRPEVHVNYLDIQFTPDGEEIFGFATDTGTNEIDEDLLAVKDVKYYKRAENEAFIKTKPGDFFVFFPWDVHRPGCVEEGPKTIRKVVIKINMENI